MLSDSRKTGIPEFLERPAQSRRDRTKIGLTAKVPNLAPDQARYAAPLLSLPENPNRFRLATPNTDTICDDVQTKSSALHPPSQFL